MRRTLVAPMLPLPLARMSMPRRCRVSSSPQGMEPKGSMQLIRAEVPLSEMLTYDAELTSMTGGRGSYHMEMDHYDEVPAHLQEKIIAASKSERGAEAEDE